MARHGIGLHTQLHQQAGRGIVALQTCAGQGLLGEIYASLNYSYIDLDAPTHADNFSFGFNQPLNVGLDAVFSYDWM